MEKDKKIDEKIKVMAETIKELDPDAQNFSNFEEFDKFMKSDEPLEL